MTADLESLKSMSPIETKDGKSNKPTIDELTNEYLNLASKWEAEKNRIESKMGDFFSTKGINSLFLFISLYCVIDMFFIACDFQKSNEISNEYWFACCTMLSTIGSIVYFCLILSGKTKNVTKGKLYVIVTGIIFALWLLSIFAYSLNSIIASCFTLMREDTFLCLSDTLAVILPFWGFILCLVFITCVWMQINAMIKDSIMTLQELHAELHNRKQALDQTYESFKPSEQMKFN